MAGRRPYYTDYPRTILWLIRGGELVRADGERVEIGSLYLGKFPITNRQYEAFDPGFERSPASPGDRDPATGVSWHDAAAYCAWYAEVSRKPMRLPTCDEWEHACRGGGEGSQDGRWFWGDEAAAGDPYVWDAETSGGTLHPLDERKANPFGLYGMLGGVWEWTGSLYTRDAPDGTGDDRRVLRGGSFNTPRAEATCAHRRPEPPDARFPDAGFRIARSLR